MISGIHGRLIPASFARDGLSSIPGVTSLPHGISASLASWAHRLEAALGAASSVRAITDVAVVPLVSLLGLAVVRRVDGTEASTLYLRAGSSTIVAVVIAWTEPLEQVWRSSIVSAIGSDARWCLCCNGRAVRVVDARRTWSREFLEFDCALLGREPDAQSVLWTLLNAEAFAGECPVLDRAVELSRRQGIQVCRDLGAGVLQALELLISTLAIRKGHAPLPVLFEQSLTVLYRVLFLLFAEARGLLPLWHPVYRDRYSLDVIVTALLSGERYRGLSRAVQAISRLAHAGCIAGELRVTAFNGRLFAPSQAEAFDRTPVSDSVMSQAVIAVSTTPVARMRGRSRILYRDLDVEQLGAVYERVLDYEPAPSTNIRLVRTRDARKASGTFYTPRAMTDFLVRRTLEPLVKGRTADDILSLRILDPAMGSGAFLVAACRFMSAAVEDALVAEGRWHADEVTIADRALVRRDVASRCLYGVDLNPMAVQLARLSLWLATLATDRPLSFLDHHLVSGNSLVGASPDDLRRQPPGGRSRRPRSELLPLFEGQGPAATLEHAVRVRLQLAAQPDDSASIVRAKERKLADLHARSSSLGTWWRLLDLWCAGWFWDDGSPPDRGTFHELVAQLTGRSSALSDRTCAGLLNQADTSASRHRFHHWPLAFPEAFLDGRGEPRGNPGFDAVVGNPPWDMVRGDAGEAGARAGRRHDARRLIDFVRESGVYRVEGRSHANLYQLFVERALQLVRAGGRIGLILPSGFATDAGAAPLRRHVMGQADIDEITGLDNRDAIFPIHRSTRFVLVTCTSGRPTERIRCRFGISDVGELERDDTTRQRLTVTRAFLRRLSGEDDLGIPELTGQNDLALLERISATVPRLSDADGWHVQFGRELNASDDRDAFVPRSGQANARPVLEGKHLEPFRVSLDQSRTELNPDRTRRVPPYRARLAYRDVASATNRLTLIAAIIPARAVTTHTLFCLRTRLPLQEQRVLCALLNSFVANYLIRFRVNTHVTVALVSRLPVPLVRAGHPIFDRLDGLADALQRSTSSVEGTPEYAELQALCARAYGVRAEEFEHVLGTFPLIRVEVREHSLAAFRDLG